ncbi:MAG: (deoxy)nucleoside triphosphate pyrophosphohydrolase [Acidobacteria bacterium]|nr:(deoxy)nucleoside triphosphate pyrophosphohydrolase [Acidobacteriota bacterium]
MIRRLVVVAALIERDGLLLIGQRKQGDRHAFKWEFPGGKVEAGESPRDALLRELKEELQIDAEVGEEVVRYEYRYPARSPILLIFHRVSHFVGEPRNAEFEQIRWEEPAKLPSYDFLDGDFDFVRRLARGEFRH